MRPHSPFLFLLCATSALAAATPQLDEATPWPRVRSTNGNTVTIYQPQAERWTSNWFSARAAVEVKPANAKSELVGVVWFESHASVDRSSRIVTLDGLEITKGRFPDAPDKGSNALEIVRQVIPSGARTVSLDYLITALGFSKAAARQGPRGLQHTPPEIIWATNRSVLIIIDGNPVLRPVAGVSLQRVINTPALLVQNGADGKFYLYGDGRWFAAGVVEGPWSLAQTPPPEVSALSASGGAAPGDDPIPAIVVRTHPAELLATVGLPVFKAIPGTALQFAENTDSELFFHTGERAAYLLVSGRWFKAGSLQGPWNYVAPHDLPDDFARIPPSSPAALALASVPGTPQAELALLANSVPTTATVNRHEAAIQLSYDGEPKFNPIEGTSMTYAVNAQLPVINSKGSYYALDNGVWFTAASASGPWEVAAEVPEEIYTIPPQSPVYYATFAQVYDSTNDEAEVGYTPGYQGSYEDDGTVVYGTGWDYQPWYGDEYYGWGWSWGYGYVYVPWYQWWTWRNWWDHPNALRSAVIENMYDRWQGRNGVVHHDRAPNALAQAGTLAAISSYPALYGRFKGSDRPAQLGPPPNTLALNPYKRPKTPITSGQVPHGAQLLTAVNKAPGGARDLYASPDGGIYRRQNDGWYRRASGGKWDRVAPLQGNLQANAAAAGAARNPQAAGAAAVYRPIAAREGAGAKAQALANRVPDSGARGADPDIKALEREYYARTLAQMRMQNARRYNAPVRAVGRRR